MEYASTDLIVLGAIKRGAKKFEKIQKMTKIDPEELNKTLENLEKKDMIRVEKKKGWLGEKIEIQTTEIGDAEVERGVYELKTNWDQMVQTYKSGDKKKLKDEMDGFKGMFPMFMFFGIVDIMMFSMMFSMIGASMTDYVPADQVPSDMQDSGADGGGMDDGGFDFDIGF